MVKSMLRFFLMVKLPLVYVYASNHLLFMVKSKISPVPSHFPSAMAAIGPTLNCLADAAGFATDRRQGPAKVRQVALRSAHDDGLFCDDHWEDQLGCLMDGRTSVF